MSAATWRASCRTNSGPCSPRQAGRRRLKSKLGAQAPEIGERLQHLTESLTSGIALKRRIIEDLRPSSLANLGLTAALEILAREFSEHSGIEVALSLENVELDEPRQLTVYRIVQESLTNVGKYAEARQVDISLRDYSNHVEVEVRDNGKLDVAQGSRRRTACGMRTEWRPRRAPVVDPAGAGTPHPGCHAHSNRRRVGLGHPALSAASTQRPRATTRSRPPDQGSADIPKLPAGTTATSEYVNGRRPPPIQRRGIP